MKKDKEEVMKKHASIIIYLALSFIMAGLIWWAHVELDKKNNQSAPPPVFTTSKI